MATLDRVRFAACAAKGDTMSKKKTKKLTRRDKFAIAFLPLINVAGGYEYAQRVSEIAYSWAEVMMKARKFSYKETP